jgi:hypothetical protein
MQNNKTKYTLSQLKQKYFLYLAPITQMIDLFSSIRPMVFSYTESEYTLYDHFAIESY